MENFTSNSTLLQLLENSSNIATGADKLGAVGMNLSQPPEMDVTIYFKIALLCVIVVVGTVGNIMVTLVISCSRDMRTSTNIFLVNLSIADLLVLVVCTPTALVEVTYQNSDVWVMGSVLCKLIPLLEATVANGSVLTILAISFERYYVICRPLRANYVCTKTRAACISMIAWIVATFVTSPMYFMIDYHPIEDDDLGRCLYNTGELWMDIYTISMTILLFLVPVVILLVMYGMIANRLTMDRSNLNAKNENHKARKQVVIMLGTVVFTFFLCLLPFRVLTMVFVFAEYEHFREYERFYSHVIYICRVMAYMNSALNPILYNIMSSKFRNGFLRLCHRRRKSSPFVRNGTFLTNTTTSTTTNMSINLGHHGHHGNGYTNGYIGQTGGSPEFTASLIRKNGVTKLDQHTLNKYIHSQMNGNLKNLNMNGDVLPTNPNSVPYVAHSNIGSPNKSRNCSIKTLSGSGSGKFRTSFTSSVKSNSVYSAYIPGNNKTETVL